MCHNASNQMSGAEEVPKAKIMDLYEPRPVGFVKEFPANLPGANRKSLFEDNEGKLWLFKPQPLEQTLIDVVVARIARQAGVASPIVYAVDFRWHDQRRQGSIQPFLKGRIRQSELSRTLIELSKEQREDLQRHHVVDWLIANPDTHRGQFLVLNDNTLVAVDKSQALRFFPHDCLDWNSSAWPLNTRPPVYKYLYAGYQTGRFGLEAKVAVDFADNASQIIADSWWQECWRPIVSEWSWMRLVYATLEPLQSRGESVKQVLQLLQQRKFNLAADFRELYRFVDPSGRNQMLLDMAVVRSDAFLPKKPADEEED